MRRWASFYPRLKVSMTREWRSSFPPGIKTCWRNTVADIQTPPTNAEPILSLAYWKKRIEEAQWEHSSVFITDPDTWAAVEARHREILSAMIAPFDSIFDAGCAWGRLLDLLPKNWNGRYLGVDLSPDFLEIAKKRYKGKRFLEADLRDLHTVIGGYDWAICISIKEMVIRNLDRRVWFGIELELRRIARRVLLLEYSPIDEGVILER
jgi:SAM-dependent methyltransferase